MEEVYEKASVKYGTLVEDGRKISFVLVHITIKQEVDEVEISDYKNDIYELKGTDYYIKFRGYYGYAKYGNEGVLVVRSSAYSSTFFKKP